MAPKTLVIIVSAIFILMFSVTPGFSEDQAFEKLIKATCIKCKFPTGTTANWDSGQPKLEKSSMKNEMIFDAINHKDGNARFIGNMGSSDVIILFTPSGLHFLEQTTTGGVNFTTVFFDMNKSGTEYVAVHSRHLSVNGPFPSQYHGACKIWD